MTVLSEGIQPKVLPLEVIPEAQGIKVFLEIADLGREPYLRVLLEDNSKWSFPEIISLDGEDFIELSMILKNKYSSTLYEAERFLWEERKNANTPSSLVDFLVPSDSYLPISDDVYQFPSSPLASIKMGLTPSTYTLSSMSEKVDIERLIIFFDLQHRWNLALWKMPETVIASADWHDKKGIQALIQGMQAPENILAMASLLNPQDMLSAIALDKVEKSIAPFNSIERKALNNIRTALPQAWKGTKSDDISRPVGYVSSNPNFGVLLLGNRIIAVRTEVPSLKGFKKFVPKVKTDISKFDTLKFKISTLFTPLLIASGVKKKIDYIFSDNESLILGKYFNNQGRIEWALAYALAVKKEDMRFVESFGPTYLDIWATNLTEEQWSKIVESQEVVSYRFLSSMSL